MIAAALGDIVVALIGATAAVLVVTVPLLIQGNRNAKKAAESAVAATQQIDTRNGGTIGTTVHQIDLKLDRHMAALGHPLMLDFIVALSKKLRPEDGEDAVRTLLLDTARARAEREKLLGSEE